uniref:DUF6598 domain-containing protein n=1 Tax=Oryza meridionalis TaxID=40149 RepID=A0A0E0F7F3_9ORYZ
MDPLQATEGEGGGAKAVTTCFAEFASEANLDVDDGGGDNDEEEREYQRAKREDELKRRWISSVLAMAGREVDAGVVDPASVYYYKSAEDLYESSRDLRHVRKTMDWHLFYNMHVLSPTPLGPMDHWNNCRNKGDGCKEEPYAMLQIFDVKVLPFALDVTRPVEVYGIIAVRDDVDENRRNYIFNRSRDNPVLVTPVFRAEGRDMCLAREEKWLEFDSWEKVLEEYSRSRFCPQIIFFERIDPVSEAAGTEVTV